MVISPIAFCAFPEICFYIQREVSMSLMFLWNSTAGRGSRRQKLDHFFEIQRVHVHLSITESWISPKLQPEPGYLPFNEVPKALACERNFIGTYMSFQRMFTPENVVLCLGNSCILNSLAHCNCCSSHAQHGTNPSLCFELQNYCLVVLHSLPRFALWLLASVLLFESTSSEQRNLLARVTGHSCTSAHQLL